MTALNDSSRFRGVPDMDVSGLGLGQSWRNSPANPASNHGHGTAVLPSLDSSKGGKCSVFQQSAGIDFEEQEKMPSCECNGEGLGENLAHLVIK